MGVVIVDKKDLTIISDSEYLQMLEKIKSSYKDRQLKAAISVNSEMLKFYYSFRGRNYRLTGRKQMGKWVL